MVVGVEVDKETFDKATMAIVRIGTIIAFMSLVKITNTHRVSRENLNQIIKRNSNYKIDLNREVKQLLKKNDIPIYYIGKE